MGWRAGPPLDTVAMLRNRCDRRIPTLTKATFGRAAACHLPAIVGLLADDTLGRRREDADLPLDPAYLAAFEAIDADPNQLLVVALDNALPAEGSRRTASA